MPCRALTIKTKRKQFHSVCRGRVEQLQFIEPWSRSAHLHSPLVVTIGLVTHYIAYMLSQNCHSQSPWSPAPSQCQIPFAQKVINRSKPLLLVARGPKINENQNFCPAASSRPTLMQIVNRIGRILARWNGGGWLTESHFDDWLIHFEWLRWGFKYAYRKIKSLSIPAAVFFSPKWTIALIVKCNLVLCVNLSGDLLAFASLAAVNVNENTSGHVSWS